MPSKKIEKIVKQDPSDVIDLDLLMVQRRDVKKLQ